MRAGPEQHSAILGLCPKCDHWFPCDEWFDRTVPVPCCSDCQLPPRKLAYTGPSPSNGVTGGVRSEISLG